MKNENSIINLRGLKLDDAPFMFEWMHDKNVVEFFETDFAKKSLEDAKKFIVSSWDDNKNLHLAIVDENDEYLGTVSLKNIGKKNAEFGIVVRSKAMGKGCAWQGMKKILEIAFNKYCLEQVFWCVKKTNIRALKFYIKNNFSKAVTVPNRFLKLYKSDKNLKWFAASKYDLNEVLGYVAGCKIIHIKTIRSSNKYEGQLSFFESFNDISFNIKRVYYTTKVAENIKRGFHAHKSLKQVLFCPFGRIKLDLESESGKGTIILSDSSTAVIIEKPTWREITWLNRDSVLIVAASDFYCEDDYIRNYDEFKAYLKQLGDNI